jgi:uncharacterized membrane protein YidH (DUF202 family)
VTVSKPPQGAASYPPPPQGAAPERTRLAWRRTVLAATAVAVLAVRLAITGASPAVAAFVIAFTTATWLAFALVAQRRIAQLDAHDGVPPTRSLTHVVRLISVYEVIALVLVLRSR